MPTTVARQLADYAAGVSYQSLPKEVVRQAKKCLLDTLACAFGGYDVEPSRMVQELVRELAGPKESTVFGNGLRTSCLNATLANGLMVRYLDYNDYWRNPDRINKSGAHPSECIPPVLALAERQGSSMKEAIAAIVVGYELLNRFMEFIGSMEASLESKGWNDDCRGSVVMPIVVGKMLGLTPEQMENAAGISGSYAVCMGILDAPGEEYTMTKSIRFPRINQSAIVSAMLAKRGFTGPVRIVEGNSGFMKSIMRGDYDASILTKPRDKYNIMTTCFKAYSCDGTNQGHVNATLNLVKKHNLKPADIKHVTLKLPTRAAEHCGDPVKKHPHNKETADHSAYYMTAMAIIDRAVGPAQFTPARIADKKAHELIDLVSVEAMTELNKFREAGISEITTKDGRTLVERIEFPRGHFLNPFTDADVEEKFRGTASLFLSASRVKKLMDAVWNIESVGSVTDLMKLTVFDREKA